MSPSPELTVFDSADELQISTEDYSICLAARGFLMRISGYGALRLNTGTEPTQHDGYDQPLSYVQSGGPDRSNKIVWFTSLEEAEQLVKRLSESIMAKRANLHEPDSFCRSFLTKAGEVISNCTMALAVCFLGSGAAHIGWAITKPMAERVAHSQNDEALAAVMGATDMMQFKESDIKARDEIREASEAALSTFDNRLEAVKRVLNGSETPNALNKRQQLGLANVTAEVLSDEEKRVSSPTNVDMDNKLIDSTANSADQAAEQAELSNTTPPAADPEHAQVKTTTTVSDQASGNQKPPATDSTAMLPEQKEDK